MSLANPWGLLALAAIPLVLYLHRRSTGARYPVPLVRLWTPASSAPLIGPRRWRPDPILLVRLLIVIGIALGLAHPGWPTRESQRRVFLIDASASMLTREADGPRIRQALAAADRLLGELPAGDAVMVLRAGAPPTVAHDFSEDRRSVRAAIVGLAAGEARKNFAAALQEVGRRLAGAPGVVHVFSDVRDEATLARLAARAGLPAETVRLHAIGGPAENVGITALDALAAPGSPLDREVFAEVANFSRRPRALEVALNAADGARERRRLDLGAGERRGLVFVTGRSPWIEVRLEGVADALPADDRAVLVLSDDPLRVLYASRGDPFVDAALRAHPGLSVRTIAADALAGEPRSALTEHLAVIDGARVSRDFPLPALIFSAGDRAPRGRAVPLTDWQRAHPILGRLDLGEALVPSGAVLAASSAPALLSSAEGAVARASEDGGVRRVEIAFAVRHSSLGRLPDFPVVVARALDWLVDGSAARPLNLRAGETARLTFPGASAGEATVYRPDGSTSRVPVEGDRVDVLRTDLVGRYEVALREKRAEFAVNLLDRDESNVDRPAPMPAGSSAGPRGSLGSPAGWSDLDRWVLAAALQFLSVEIWLLQRRAQKAAIP